MQSKVTAQKNPIKNYVMLLLTDVENKQKKISYR